MYLFLKSKLSKNKLHFFNSKKLRYNRFIDELCHINIELENRISGLFDDLKFSEIFDENYQALNVANKSEATIAIAGKTKAGKSTLFNLLCGTGRELIGKYSTQRTSKCSVVTHYNGIKIVDTPGLASASEKGKRDNKIALEECYKADDILFVMPNDTYSEEQKYIYQIICHNKPISILFNYINAKMFLFNSNLNELLGDPQKWIQGVSNWKNQLIRSHTDKKAAHILNDKIYYSFLIEADKEKVLSLIPEQTNSNGYT